MSLRNACIIGSGFGFYGYLPVLAEKLDVNILLPRGKESVLAAREDLADKVNKITWVESEAAALSKADTVVIAIPPLYQVDYVKNILHFYPKVTKLFLEKPLADTPQKSLELLKQLEATSVEFEIGYLFLYTEWFEEINWAKNKKPIHIIWSFNAHHYVNGKKTWKNNHRIGGGALRFYGIHLIAFLSLLGYFSCENSVLEGNSLEDIDKWRAKFIGPDNLNCFVDVDSRSNTNIFDIYFGNELIYSNEDPFKERSMSYLEFSDKRIPALERMISGSKTELFKKKYIQYCKINDLWGAVESATQFEGMAVSI